RGYHIEKRSRGFSSSTATSLPLSIRDKRSAWQILRSPHVEPACLGIWPGGQAATAREHGRFRPGAPPPGGVSPTTTFFGSPREVGGPPAFTPPPTAATRRRSPPA